MRQVGRDPHCASLIFPAACSANSRGSFSTSCVACINRVFA